MTKATHACLPFASSTAGASRAPAHGHDEWDLVAAYDRAAADAPRRQPMLSLLALLVVALSRKAFELAKRAGRATPAPAGVLPGGGAPA